MEKNLSSGTAREVREYKDVDASEIVSARIKEGNWKFLAFDGGMMETTFIPGLSKEEVQRFVDSGLYGWEIFYSYHARFVVGSSPSDEKALWDARMNYAERVNRQLVEEILKKEPNKSPQTIRTFGPHV